MIRISEAKCSPKNLQTEVDGKRNDTNSGDTSSGVTNNSVTNSGDTNSGVTNNSDTNSGVTNNKCGWYIQDTRLQNAMLLKYLLAFKVFTNHAQGR
jgi:hypothetical protein